VKEIKNKSCKKCKGYNEKKRWCNIFNISVSSTLNAVKCTSYSLSLNKSRDVKSSSKSKLKKKDYLKRKRAKICLNCSSNKDGYCFKYKNWCSRVNYICLDIPDPEGYKFPKKKNYNKIKKNPNSS